jgi:hypothetical protein
MPLTQFHLVVHPGVKFRWLTELWSPEEVDTAKQVTLAAVSEKVSRTRHFLTFSR